MKYVIGHKNPDTDAICSSFVYQSFLEKNGIESKVYSLGMLNKETQFVFSKYGIEAPQVVLELPDESEVILLDHNEATQSIDNLDRLDLVGIIDHHKVSINTSKPIEIDVRPVGSSCTIVADKFFTTGTNITDAEAGLLISGILSDTLYFRSPTATEVDKEIVDKLNEIAKIDNLDDYAMDMFNAKSDLGDMDIESIVTMDYKKFVFGGKDYSIGVMETTNPEYGLSRKDEIEEKLYEIKQRDNLDGIIFSIIDIINEESYTFCSDDETVKIFKEAFDADENDRGALFVDNLVSRKKQIVPVLADYLSR